MCICARASEGGEMCEREMGERWERAFPSLGSRRRVIDNQHVTEEEEVTHSEEAYPHQASLTEAPKINLLPPPPTPSLQAGAGFLQQTSRFSDSFPPGPDQGVSDGPEEASVVKPLSCAPSHRKLCRTPGLAWL